MSYSMNFDKRIDCIVITVTGNFISLMNSLAAEPAKFLNEQGCRCILHRFP